MRFHLAFLALPLAVALLAGACGGEGEGMPCDTRAGNGGNDDCASGLICTPGLANAQGARCCPQNRQTATTPECSLGSTNATTPNPPDASGGTEASSDGPAEAASEAAAEGGTTGDASDGSSSGDGAGGADGPAE
jgi:hypothetical protein